MLKKNSLACLSTYERYRRLKRKFYILLVAFLLLFAGMAYYVYLNYNYFVFKHLIAQNYVYTETLDEIYSEILRDEPYKSYYKSFDDIVISIVTKYIREKNNDTYTYLYLPQQYTDYNNEDREEAVRSMIEELSDTTVYIKITNFSKYTRKFLDDNKELLNSYENLVIDLQSNPGGMIEDMNKMADLFLEKGSIISTDETKVSLFSSQRKAKGAPYFLFDNIAILQNSRSASASESFIAALRDNLSNVTLIGETTFGKGIGQITIPLKGGYAVKATVLKWYTPNGNSIHKLGILPDVEFKKDDGDIIDFAMRFVEGR